MSEGNSEVDSECFLQILFVFTISSNINDFILHKQRSSHYYSSFTEQAAEAQAGKTLPRATQMLPCLKATEAREAAPMGSLIRPVADLGDGDR